MKKTIIFTIIIFCTISCQNNNSDTEKLNQKLDKLNLINNELIERISFIESEFIKPYSMYEEAVLNENKRNPDSIISTYQTIIKKFPKSYWSHESQKRINNVEKRRGLWSKDKGWDLLKIEPIKDIKTISCPGC